MIWREHGQAPRVVAAGMHVALEREQNLAAPGVLVALWFHAGMPVVALEFVVGGGHELLSLVFVLADEDHEGGLFGVAEACVAPPVVEEGVVAAQLAEVLVDAAGAVVLDEEDPGARLAVVVIDFEHGVG